MKFVLWTYHHLFLLMRGMGNSSQKKLYTAKTAEKTTRARGAIGKKMVQVYSTIQVIFMLKIILALAFANQKEIYAPENCSSLHVPPSFPSRQKNKWSIPYFVNNLPQFVVFSCIFLVCVMYKASPPWLQTWFPTSINIYISRRGNSQPYSP